MDSKTWKRLKTFGKFGESFDDILNRLMDATEEYQRALNSFAEPAAIHKLKPQQPQQDEKLGVENVTLNPGVVSSRVAGSAAMTLDKGLEKRFLESSNEDIENAKKIPGLDKRIKLIESTLSTVRIRLPGIEFPTNKEKIIQHAVMANQDSIINILENIPDRVYENPVDFEMEKTLRDPNRKITVVKFFPELNKNLRLKRAIGRVIVDTRDIRQDEREQLLQQQEQQLSS
jgi:hypothetical protein